MAFGNGIVVSAQPRGPREEGYTATAEKPGTIMQRDASVATLGGRHTYKVYQPGVDGGLPVGAYWVLDWDPLSGKRVTDAYAAGGRCFFYGLVVGEEYNILVKDLPGTADDHPIGERMVVDHATGKLVVSAGSEQSIPFQLLEAITDPAADTLAWVQFGLG